MADIAFKLPLAAADRKSSEPSDDRPRQSQHPFRVVSPPKVSNGAQEQSGSSLADSWGGLIEQISSAAARLRAEEARLQEREEHLQELVLRTREEIHAAAERVLRAEAQARDVEAQCKREIAELEKRTLAAEEKARSMEAWSAKLRETIIAEFG